eukprot:scaffold9178_cov176-Amphora_coffeaeformis.AAC.6
MKDERRLKLLHPGMTTRRGTLLLSVFLLAILWGDTMLHASAFVVPRQVSVSKRDQNFRLFVKETDSPKASKPSGTQTRRPDNNKQQNRSPRNRQQGRPSNNNNNSNKNNSFQKQKRLNRQLVQCDSADDLFQLLQKSPGALTKRGGGGVLNTVNFSTSIHRLARHSLQPKARTPILADPRLALLLAGVAEALAGEEALSFSSREISNIGWALAKLRVAPPSSAMPVQTSPSSDQIVSTAKDIRIGVMEASKAKQPGEALKPVWIPALSKLAGLILDDIGGRIEYSKELKQQEMSNLLWAWATADRADPVVFGKVIRRMIAQDTDDRQPQEWSNAVWAFATARVYEGKAEMFDFLAHLMEDEAFVDGFKPQEISNTLWGCATLFSNAESEIPAATEQSVLRIIRSFAPRIVKRAHHFKTQELSNALWGVATLGFGLTISPEIIANNYVCLPSKSPEMDKELKGRVIESIIGAAQEKLHQFRSQELNNVAWAMARLLDENKPSAATLLQGIGMEMCNPRRRVTSQDIGTTIWSFATLEFFNDNLYRGLLSRFTPDMVHSCKPQELSNTVWAVATAEIDIGPERDAFDTTFLSQEMRPVPQDLITSFFGEAGAQVIQRPQEFKPQEIKDILWSFSKCNIRHPELFRSTAEYLVGREEDGYATPRGLSDFSPQGLGNMAWAFARQAQLAEEVADRYKSKSATPLTGGRLAYKSAICLDVGEGLIHKLFSEIAETNLRVHNELSALRPQDISNTAWTLGVLAICHDEFAEACKMQLKKRTKLYMSGKEDSMTYFKGQEISNLLWGLATLNSAPGDMIDSVGPYLRKISQDKDGKVSVRSIASVFKRQELANIAWSCAVFGEYPSDLMTFLYGGLLGDKKDPESLAKIYEDGGLQGQAVMTLLYVQAAMDLSGSASGLTLPPDFPDDWQRSSSVAIGDVVAPTFELALTTSKIQRDVSAAFNRIGFEHVEEHVISMEGLASEYNVNLNPKPVEVLSIDIADVSRRIAIEVDGPAHFLSSISDLGAGAKGFRKLNKGKLEYQFNWTGENERINGPTALKERLLKSLGWKVIHLPFWEWYALDGEEAEDAYCRNLLNQLQQ